jgi:hypothetical protein
VQGFGLEYSWYVVVQGGKLISLNGEFSRGIGAFGAYDVAIRGAHWPVRVPGGLADALDVEELRPWLVIAGAEDMSALYD